VFLDQGAKRKGNLRRFRRLQLPGQPSCIAQDGFLFVCLCCPSGSGHDFHHGDVTDMMMKTCWRRKDESWKEKGGWRCKSSEC